MKSLLSENMLRFGVKNLTESQQRELVVKSIMETIDQHGLRNVIYRRLTEQKIPPHNPELEKQFAGSAGTKYGINSTIATPNPMKAKPGGKYMTQYTHAGYSKQNVGSGTDASTYIVIPKGTTFIADQATNCVYATVQRGMGWKQGQFTFAAYDAIDPAKQGELISQLKTRPFDVCFNFTDQVLIGEDDMTYAVPKQLLAQLSANLRLK